MKSCLISNNALKRSFASKPPAINQSSSPFALASHPLDSIRSFLFLRQTSFFLPFSSPLSLSPLHRAFYPLYYPSAAVPLFFHVTPFLSSNQLAITSQFPPRYPLPFAPLASLRLDCAASVTPRATSCINCDPLRAR